MTSPVSKISIVTPSLNQAKFLGRTIKSVIDQRYDNLQYVIIDGKSTDDSVGVIRSYEEHLEYWVSELDKGQTEAINKGLGRIDGDIWAYLCSDDTYEPDTFTRVIGAFEETGADVVFGNCNFINASDVVTRHKKPGAFDRDRLLRNNYIYQPSVFLKRWILEEFGPFDESLRYSMDFEYWLRISTKARFVYVDETFSNYRLHPDSKSMSAIHGMNKEGRQVKKKYGVGLAADVEFARFKLIGAPAYLGKRWFFEQLARLRGH